MTIQYFNALAGAGKTYALVGYAHQLASAGELVLFIQPSKLLIDNTLVTEVRKLNPRFPVRAIHGSTSEDVVKDIVKHMSSAVSGQGQILFITHEAFLRLPYVERRSEWHLIFDETPSVDVYEAINVPDTHRVITDAIEFQACDAAYGRLSEKEGSDLSKIARNRRDDQVWRVFGGLASRIASPHWEVYGLQSNYHSLLRDDGGCRQLITHSLLLPSIFDGFKQVIIASALFEDSCLYRLWTGIGIEMQPVDPGMRKGLRYQRHGNGPLVTINYVAEADWSKTLRDRSLVDRAGHELGSMRDQLPKLIGTAMGQRAFAWMGNKDLGDDYLGTSAAVRLPNSPHGLNSFQHLDHVVVLSALNPPPAHFQFMETRGVNADELRRAHYRTAVYQAAMRISIRDPDSVAPKSVTVMDLSTANWLADLFEGSTVVALGGEAAFLPRGKPGRPRLHASTADRVRAHRERQRALKADLMQTTQASGFGTAYASIYDADPMLHLDLEDEAAFIGLLRDLHARQIPSKHRNFLFSPTHFDPHVDGVETRRGQDNVCHVRGIWLDNDGGDLTHAEFARLFPTLRMVVWNTYSSTKANARWRCYIPTTAAVTGDAYRAIVTQIMQVLRYAGYVSAAEVTLGSSRRDYGFDVSKFTASSLFYAPCQAADPRDSFFVDHDGEGRIALDAQLWIDNDIRPVEVVMPGPIAAEDADIAEGSELDARVINAVETWRAAPSGKGNESFFRLALDLRKARLPKDEIRRHLHGEAAKSRSPRDRKMSIAGIMRVLSRRT